MEIEKINWNQNSYSDFVNYLISLSDIKYKEFHNSIANTNIPIIGVRVPIMRSISKKILKTNVEEFFKVIKKDYYEEIMIYGLVLSSSNEELLDKYLLDFIKYIDNWAICDSFCSNLKIVNKKMGKYWMYFTNLIDLNKEFQTRVSIIILMDYYLVDDYIDRVLNIVTNIKSDYYYINMGISWLLSFAFIKYQDKVLDVFESNKLSKFIQNKTISKIRDSYRVDKSIKEMIIKYRID